MGYIFEYICANYPRFVQQVPITAIRVSKRIAFVELFDFLFIWIIDIIIFKRSVRIFIDRIYDYKRFPQLIIYIRQQDPFSIGITPTRSRSPVIIPFSDQSDNLSIIDKAIVRRIVIDVIQTIIAQLIAAAISSNIEPGSFGIVLDISSGTSIAFILRWNPNELRFFDFQYDGKIIHSDAVSIKYIDKDIYFRDVHFFIDRVK